MIYAIKAIHYLRVLLCVRFRGVAGTDEKVCRARSMVASSHLPFHAAAAAAAELFVALCAPLYPFIDGIMFAEIDDLTKWREGVSQRC